MKRTLGLIALSVLVAIGRPSAVASTFNVNSTDDILNPPAGTVTLRSAIQAANSTPGGNTINLTVPGTYRITIPGANTGTNVSGAFAILPGGGDLSIINTSGGLVVVDAGQLDRVFDINPTFNPAKPNTAFTVTMEGFTITNGLPIRDSTGSSFGGGIRTQGIVSLTVSTMIISANAADFGGGIGANDFGSPSTVTLNNTMLSNNRGNTGGGGIAAVGSVDGIVINSGSSVTGNVAGIGGGLYINIIPGSLSVQGSDIGLNRAFSTDFGFSGGGIYYAGPGTVTLTGSTIHDNSAAAGYGGGLGVTESAHSVSISNCKFSNNQAKEGGAIVSFTSMTIVFTEVDGNFSSTFSGGIEVSGTSLVPTTFTLQNSAIVNNIAESGAGGMGISATGTGNAASSISNSTISGNIVLSAANLVTGTGTGGGINAGFPGVPFPGELNLVGVTVSGNSAGAGGGIFLYTNATNFTVQDSIIAKNTAATGPDANSAAGIFIDKGGNLIGNAEGSALWLGATQTGFGFSPLDPMLGPLQDNGGPTRTLALLTGSPALGTAVASSLTTDQRGVPRPQGPKPDVGAFELNQGATPKASLSTNVLDFGTLEVTTSKALTVTLNSTGDAPLTISNASVTGPNAGDFSFTPQAACTPLPVNVPGGQSCGDTVTFTPSAVGARSATLTFADNHMNAPNSRQSVTLSGIGNGNPDFSISASPSSATINRGSSASFTFTVTPVNGFNQGVAFACAGLPSLAQCSFAPASVTPNGSPATTTLTISTVAASASNRAPLLRDNPASLRASLSFAGLLAGLLLTAAAKRRKTRLWGQVVLVGTLCVIGGLTACGGGGTTTGTKTVSPGAPTGTSTITVVSQSSGTAHTATVTITVN